jgi:hypothetical protein
MPNALLYIKKEVLKLHQIAEEGKEAETAAAARSFLGAMGMELQAPVLAENVPHGRGLVHTRPEYQNSMNSKAESSIKSHLSSASTERLTISRTGTTPNLFVTIKHHCENPTKARLEKHQSYGSTEETKASLLNSDYQDLDLPKSLKMGLDCGCPACKFLDEKAKNSTKKLDYCCCCCPVYKNTGALEAESKQDFEQLHRHLDEFFNQNSELFEGLT